MKKYSEEIEHFLCFLEQCKADLKDAEKQEALADKQTQDILHCLEFQELSLHDYIAVGIEQKNIRQNRRKAKDVRETLTQLVDWVAVNKRFIDQLTQMLGKVRKAEKNVEKNRYYVDRTDIVKKVLSDNTEQATGTNLKA